MKFKFYFTLIMIVVVGIMSGCNKSPYDIAVEHIEELDKQVTSSTTMDEFDEVYNEIIDLKTELDFKKLKNLTHSEKEVLVLKMTSLTIDALAVKAILYEMPDSIKPSVEDIKVLSSICVEHKAKLTPNPGYQEVRSIISDYYKAK